MQVPCEDKQHLTVLLPGSPSSPDIVTLHCTPPAPGSPTGKVGLPGVCCSMGSSTTSAQAYGLDWEVARRAQLSISAPAGGLPGAWP